MVSLGPYWNTRIILIPQGKVKRQGPYLILRHPNYLVVNLEFILLPLLMRAPVTLVLFFIANQFILGLRIKLEESALAKFTDYKEIFDC